MPTPPPESPVIRQQLRASGVAQVIVVLKAPGARLARLLRRFRSSELSQAEALATARPRKAGRRARAGPAAASRAARVYPNLGVVYGTVDRQGLASLRADPIVAAVTGAPSLSLIRPTAAREARPARGVTWGIEKLGAPRLWDRGLTGKGVRVAHLDTGVDAEHPALAGAVASFAELDDLGELVTPSAPHDSDDHGTHTAATIAGRSVNGRSIGVAPGAELASALVIEGGDAVARVLGGLDWALTQGVKVLSMSLGFRGWWEDFLPVVRILRARGVLPVIAVGNEGPGTSRSPGNYPESLSVGAVDERLAVPGFSSSQRFSRRRDAVVPDLVAPGVDVVSARPGGGFQSMDGTSMATPHVAGLAALLLEARPAATVDEIEGALFRSCHLPKGATPERGGRGFPDVVEALRLLEGPPAGVARRPSPSRRRGAKRA